MSTAVVATDQGARFYCCLTCRKVVVDDRKGNVTTICPHTGYTHNGHDCDAR